MGLATSLTSSGANCGNRIFTMSKSFDIIAAMQYFDKIKDVARFYNLTTDSTFMSRLSHVNENIKASKLCNFYSIYGGDKNNTDSCVAFFNNIKQNDSIIRSDAVWIRDIVELQPEITYCISALNSAGYSDYWDNEIEPIFERQINAYPVSENMLDNIHDALTEFSGPEILPPTRSNTYILNIDNAFNLSDESFCCTPLLLDVELEKKFRLDFLKVYIHENLHRLSVSKELMRKLDELMADDFYRDNENVARSHNEGRNEAFVVAAEAFISHKIGRRDNRSVYDEFKEYVDGSLVLAPIIYIHIPDKQKDESLNSFILRLFGNGTIKVGSVKAEYDRAMRQLESKIVSDER